MHGTPRHLSLRGQDGHHYGFQNLGPHFYAGKMKGLCKVIGEAQARLLRVYHLNPSCMNHHPRP